MSADKPKFNIKEQVQHLKDKGVTFKYYSEQNAEKFLTKSNYYFKLKAFAKNYDKDRNNKYINLDFGYLRELSILDTLLRTLILELCLACEHLLKTQINAHCSENSQENGYGIVNNFLKEAKNKPLSLKKYEQGYKSNIYQRKLIEKYYIKQKNTYKSKFALWNFIEILTFAEFVNFYDFYYKNNKKFEKHFINQIGKIRNAAAHNFCILYNLDTKPISSFKRTEQLITRIRKIKIFHKNNKLPYLNNPLFHDCVCLLFLVKDLCPPSMLRVMERKIFKFIIRARKHKDYFKKNNKINQSFQFMVNVILRIFEVKFCHRTKKW
ncbi:hypothetical protein DMB95_06945 [Campylobacter sp. MIT 12-8780]|uniref:Abi family protein n=1 Tax=unclassified Campylobacter TaxID=2593542 RepID=UPI00115E17AF|nr:Abi family protein [Campylobacter sp. MIT 12-8780]NDJ27699.1 Abi family protein [Campylobacter sp. MIT 19-121]TQR40863.1 hypothetical protein DMB95_06945 [Campylobacter sp. MIT 12-8780]